MENKNCGGSCSELFPKNIVSEGARTFMAMNVVPFRRWPDSIVPRDR